MNFTVFQAPFRSRELVIEDGSTTIRHLCCNVEEMRILAAKLVQAADELLYGDMSVQQFVSCGGEE